LRVPTEAGAGGGQHRNVTDSAVQLTHKPTGLQVRSESERSQKLNKLAALTLLRARLAAASRQARLSQRNAARRRQLRSGMRGDKRRTIAVQRGVVVHHITGKSVSSRLYLRGHIDALHPDPPRG
jgi:peptide chain release factor 1